MTDAIPPPPAPPRPMPPPAEAPRRRWVRRALIAFLVVANLGIFGGLAAVWWAARQVTGSVSTIPAEELDLAEVPRGYDEPRTLLLIGSDSRADLPDEFDYTGDFGGQRADVIILMQILPGEDRLQLLSLPRDLKVTLAGSPGKINGAFNGGAGAIVDAVAGATGLPIHHYVQVDFAGFAGVVDAIGGIEMTFPFPARDSNASLQIDAGTHLLDGKTALAVARSRSYQELRDGRWVSVDANDIGRTRRQQDLLMAMIVQFQRPTSIGGFGALVDSLGEFVITDDGFDEDLIIQLAWEMRDLDAEDLDAETLPVADLQENGVWYVTEIQPDAAQVLSAFRAGDPMDEALAGPVPVEVQNGNGRPGAGAGVGELLAAAGYDVVGVTNSGREDYATTLVLSRPDDLPLAEQVVAELGYGEARVGRPPTTATVVVIVGLDVPTG